MNAELRDLPAGTLDRLEYTLEDALEAARAATADLDRDTTDDYASVAAPVGRADDELLTALSAVKCERRNRDVLKGVSAGIETFTSLWAALDGTDDAEVTVVYDPAADDASYQTISGPVDTIQRGLWITFGVGDPDRAHTVWGPECAGRSDGDVTSDGRRVGALVCAEVRVDE